MSTNDRSSEQLEFDFNRPPQPEVRHEPLLTIAEACGQSQGARSPPRY
jgi:hypothetical protein